MKMRKGIDDEHLTYLDAGRIAEDEGATCGRAARPHGGAAVLRHRRLVGDRPAQGAVSGHSRARQRRHLGGRRRAADGRTRPAATASWSVAAAWAGRGCSASWRRPSHGRPDAGPARRSGRSRGCCAGTPSCSCDGIGADKGMPRHAQAHGLVPQGLLGRLRDAARARAGRHPRASSTTLLGRLDPDQPYPERRRRDAARPAGHAERRVALPDGWLDDPEELVVPAGAELGHSGG